jgi:hypothetical protein
MIAGCSGPRSAYLQGRLRLLQRRFPEARGTWTNAGGGARPWSAVAERRPDGDRPVDDPEAELAPGRHASRHRGPLQQRRSLGIVAGDLDGLLEEGDRLDRRPEGLGPVRRGSQRHARLAREGVGLRPGRACLERRR